MLLRVVAGVAPTRRAVVWNLITGETRETPPGTDIWGMSADGRVLRHVWLGPAQNCVDLVQLADLATVARTGYCGPEFVGPFMEGRLSLDGGLFVLSRSGQPSLILRTEDIHNGQWGPIATIDREVDILGWLTPSAMLALPSGSVSDHNAYACTLDRCAKIDLPKEFFDLALIYGASGGPG